MSLESSQFSVRKLVIPVEKLVVPVEKLLIPVEKFNVPPRNAPYTGTSSPWHGHPARDPSRPGRPCHLRPYHGRPARDPERPPAWEQKPLIFRAFARLLRSYMTYAEKKGAWPVVALTLALQACRLRGQSKRIRAIRGSTAGCPLIGSCAGGLARFRRPAWFLLEGAQQ